MPITMFIEYLQRSMPRIEIIFLGIQQKQTLFGTEPGTECERAVEQAATKVGMYLNG